MSREQDQFELIGRPCRNFNILATAVMTDPLDGREKLVLSNFAAGQTGNLILIDTRSMEAESIELPGDEGAWGLVNWRNEKLVVGTCPNYAYMHALDLKTRTWAEPLKAADEKYFWDMAIGSDGNVYAGTWPGCSLYRYNPALHTLEKLGRASDNGKNLYSRYINGSAPGYILFTGGYDEPFLKAFHMESGTFRDFGTPGFTVREVTDEYICTVQGDRFEFYHPQTLESLPDTAGWKEKLTLLEAALPNGKSCRAIPLADGRYAGVRGQDLFIADSLDEVPELVRIPAEAPATRIHTLVSDEAGGIWGACGFGQTIFHYDPLTGSAWNSSSVCDSGGEVYGMVFVDGKLYLTAYVGGDHIVYDPAQPWDQLNNRNPQSLRALRPDYIRPEGRSVIGPDGGIWTGWSAKYGTYAGALSRIDPVTLEVDSWSHPIANDQQVAGVAADDRYVYFTTNGGASGLPYRDVICHFGVWEPGKGLVHESRFAEGERPGSAIAAMCAKVFVKAGSAIRVFDPARFRFEQSIPVEGGCSWMTAAGPDLLAAFCGSRLLFIDPHSAAVIRTVELPGSVRAATYTATGDLAFAVEEALYRVPSGFLQSVRS
ncbi:hypothetical protein [Paenibacillus sp. GCM10012303]|uniref:hypothetical protein n=1 Tax=Paenibacillus sp. GCM10012303 TaxID=3317340 RepID=UPI00361659DB